MVGIIWAIIVVLVICWAVGLAVHVLAGWIWIFLAVAVILFIYNLVTGRGARI